jgi:hypothetical protein
MRSPLLAFTTLLFASTLVPAATHAAGVDPLQVSTQQIHIGQSVTVTGTFCGNTGPEPTITYSTQTAYPKAPIITLPLTTAAVGLVQDATGFTFTFTPPTEQTSVWFDVTCDSTSASTTDRRVTVYPPIGQHWFLSPYGTLSGNPSATVAVTVRTMDCDASSTATLSLVAGGGAGAALASATATVTDGVIEFSLAIPSDAVPGSNYAAIVDCDSTGHGNLRSGDPFTVLGEAPVTDPDPEIPATGASGTLALIATGFLLVGVALSCLASRSSAPASR